MVVMLAAALFAGMIVGMLGAGGALVIAPALIGAGHVEPHQAIVVSLIVVAAISPVAAWLHHRAHHLHIRTGLWFAASSVPASFAGARLARSVSGQALMLAFGAVMVAAAVALLRRRGEPVARAPARAPAALLATGAVVGLATGAVGAGGGFVVVPALVLFAAVPVREAIGTSLVVVGLNALAGLAGALGGAPIAWRIALPLAAVAVAGTVVGAALAPRISVEHLRRAFAALLLGVAAWLFVAHL